MASTAKWGYSKDNGPSTWAKNLCIKLGDSQSPIDIIQRQCGFDSNLKKLKFTYPSFENAKLLNNGNTVLFSPPDNRDNTSSVNFGPVANQYKLAQFHFHWGENDDTGSEHTIDGEPYSGELHLVHWNTDSYGSAKEALTSKNGLVVFGIFMKVGQEDHSGLSNITAKLPLIQKAGSSTILKEPFNPSCLFPDSLEYWSYPGSLTTPPLSESVTWVVFKKPIIVSSAQVAAFRELESDDGEKVCQNFRPTCPVNKRQVKASFQ
uniref:Carbonic anhydrase n=1 Tax=Corallium rubrum TaxID=142104 RepID=A0A1B0Y769_9CNID|nr:alpha carbonic anhydrase 3 [Corallium rubrum]